MFFVALHYVAFWHLADIPMRLANVRFSNRPVWVKRY